MPVLWGLGFPPPPVGLNIFVIRNVAPDIPLSEVIWGTLPFVLLMMLAVLLLCFFPGVSTRLPDLGMGPAGGRCIGATASGGFTKFQRPLASPPARLQRPGHAPARR